MKHTEQQQKAQKFLSSIYTKAWEDSNFKQNLINNPIETLNKFTGKIVDFPEDKTISVQDQTNSNHIYINIPSKPNLDNLKLNEEQLEMIAGGSMGWLLDIWETLTGDATISNWNDHATVI
jgi:hypothetical protein